MDFIRSNNLISIVEYQASSDSVVGKLHLVFPEIGKNFMYSDQDDTVVGFYPTMLRFAIRRSVLDEPDSDHSHDHNYDHNQTHPHSEKTSEDTKDQIVFYIQSMMDDKFYYDHSNKIGSLYTLYKDSRCHIIMAEDLMHIELLRKYVSNELSDKKSGKIYNWIPSYGCYRKDARTMYDKSIHDLIGLGPYFDSIIKDIYSSLKHKEKYIRHGVSNGLNYLLHGHHGTGKSSLVRSIAMELDIPIHVAKLSDAMSGNQITDMLIPADNNDSEYGYSTKHKRTAKPVTDPREIIKSEFKIVLIEDFDRYIGNSVRSLSMMSVLFNALDGIYPSFGVIRFFSANSIDTLKQNKALFSRFNKLYAFGKPKPDDISNLVRNIFDHIQIDNSQIDEFVSKLDGSDISMRNLTHYLCGFLDADNPMAAALNGVDEWIASMAVIELEMQELADKAAKAKADIKKVAKAIESTYAQFVLDPTNPPDLDDPVDSADLSVDGVECG